MDAETSALLDAIQALLATAFTEASYPGASKAAISASLEIQAQCRALITLLTASAVGTPMRSVTVHMTARGVESLFAIAQRELGDVLQYLTIQKMNHLTFIALTPGQTLLLPAS